MTPQVRKAQQFKRDLEAARARRASRRTSGSVDVPGTFLGFCEWLGVRLSPGQSELARVAYDGAEPLDRGRARNLFGDDLPVGRRSVVAAVCGARAGKSYVLVALRLVFGMLVRDVSAVPPGPKAAALIIAPRDDLRMEVFRYALGAVRSKAELRGMLVAQTADMFRLRRPDGYEVEFKTGVATSGGTAARGQWWTDFALDECAFFRDNSFKVNDEELFRAGSARVLPGGQTIIASTPWAEAGLLYRLWKTRPEDTAVVHAPTLALNDSETTRAIIERAKQSDPDNARREFDAVFMTSGTTVFFESATIDPNVVPFTEPEPGDTLAAGGDFGFRSDSSALSTVAHRDGTIWPVDLIEQRPEEGVPLKPSKTVSEFAQIVQKRGISGVMADGHYRESVAEHLEAHDLVFVSAPTVPADAYIRARMLLREGKAKLPNNERFLQQLREVQGKPTAGGGMSIIHPRWAKGGHGDLVAAWVLAVWQVSGDEVPRPKPKVGTKEHEAELVEARHRRWTEEQQKPKWLGGRSASDRGRTAAWRR